MEPQTWYLVSSGPRAPVCAVFGAALCSEAIDCARRIGSGVSVYRVAARCRPRVGGVTPARALRMHVTGVP